MVRVFSCTFSPKFSILAYAISTRLRFYLHIPNKPDTHPEFSRYPDDRSSVVVRWHSRFCPPLCPPLFSPFVRADAGRDSGSADRTHLREKAQRAGCGLGHIGRTGFGCPWDAERSSGIHPLSRAYQQGRRARYPSAGLPGSGVFEIGRVVGASLACAPAP